MALQNKSSFTYDIEVTIYNRSLDFKSSAIGAVKQATLTLGSYTLSEFVVEVNRAMNAADPANSYAVYADRSVSGGYENRVHIIAGTSGYLSLLFSSGPRAGTSCNYLLGYTAMDYTGLTSYVGSASCGTVLVSEYVGYSYLGPDFMRSVFGSLNISARGDKEAIVWQIQKFFQVEFRFEPEAKVIAEWAPFMTWAIQQKAIEFTPNIADINTYYPCTLESTDSDGKGLGFRMTEMLPDFPFNYRTGILKFRQKVS